MVSVDRTDAERRGPSESGDLHERFKVPGAEILAEDTWGADSETCAECGCEVEASESRCPACGQWLERCSGSCPSCASPRCVGGRRA